MEIGEPFIEPYSNGKKEMNNQEVDSHLLIPRGEPCVVRPDPNAEYVFGGELGIPIFRRDFPGELPQVQTEPLSDLRTIPSGVRSTLVMFNGKLYRAKGVSLVNGELITTAVGSQDVKGGMFLDAAEYELGIIGDLGKALREKELYYGVKPAALIDYNCPIDGSPCGAAIYEVDGDDRLGGMLNAAETTLPFRYLDRSQADRMLDVFIKLAKMSGRVLRIFHDLGYSWSEDMRGLGTNSHPGNMMISDNGGKTGLSIVDLDCATQRDSEYFMEFFIRAYMQDHPEDIRTAAEIRDFHHRELQEYDYDTFRRMLVEPYVANTHIAEKYDPDSTALSLVSKYLRDSGETNDQKISKTAQKILKALRPKGIRMPLRPILADAFSDAYLSNDPQREVLEEIDWSDLRKFSREDMPQFRDDFMKRVMAAAK